MTNFSRGFFLYLKCPEVYWIVAISWLLLTDKNPCVVPFSASLALSWLNRFMSFWSNLIFTQSNWLGSLYCSRNWALESNACLFSWTNPIFPVVPSNSSRIIFYRFLWWMSVYSTRYSCSILFNSVFIFSFIQLGVHIQLYSTLLNSVFTFNFAQLKHGYNSKKQKLSNDLKIFIAGIFT